MDQNPTKPRPRSIMPPKQTAAELKHKKFAHEIVKNGGNGTAAYAKVYPLATREAAGTGASLLLKKPEVQNEIRSYQAKISELNGPLSIARDLRSLRKAKKGIYHEGTKVGSEPDHATRHAAVRTCLQAVGALNADGDGAGVAPTVNIQINTQASSSA